MAVLMMSELLRFARETGEVQGSSGSEITVRDYLPRIEPDVHFCTFCPAAISASCVCIFFFLLRLCATQTRMNCFLVNYVWLLVAVNITENIEGRLGWYRSQGLERVVAALLVCCSCIFPCRAIQTTKQPTPNEHERRLYCVTERRCNCKSRRGKKRGERVGKYGRRPRFFLRWRNRCFRRSLSTSDRATWTGE